MVGVMHTPDIILKVISSLFGRYQSEAYSINFNGECSKLTLGGLDGWMEGVGGFGSLKRTYSLGGFYEEGLLAYMSALGRRGHI